MRLRGAFVVALGFGFVLVLGAPHAGAGGGGAGVCQEQAPTKILGQAGWVAVLDYCFAPQTIDVNTGETVRWEFDGRTPHTVTFRDGPASSPLQGGATYAVQFNAPGTYEYYCAIHPGMIGTVQTSGETRGGPALQALTGDGQVSSGTANVSKSLPAAAPMRIEFSGLTGFVIVVVLLPLSMSAALAIAGFGPARNRRLRFRFPVALESRRPPHGKRS